MSTTDTDRDLTPKELAAIERKFDPETAFRTTGPIMGSVIFAALVAMSVYHFYAAGFGLIRELLHFGVHLAFVLGLGFLLFSWRRAPDDGTIADNWWSFDGVNILDIVFAVLAVGAALYLPLLPPEFVSQRVGDPTSVEIFMGSALLLITLEVARRSIGPTLPIIALIFILFALFGQYAPGALKHGGTSWLGFINHIYMTNQGIYGVAIGAMAKYVFLFIVFGALATRIGLGQLFIDLASVIAGRYSGGPAKVAICASAFMGSISGSSIGNTVTTGALTIPAMKRVGYPKEFAAATEATASTGGQITPPVMGAAAFIMVDYLNIPLRDILAAALFPALLHYFGIFVMVHLEAKKLGLRGLTAEEMPNLFRVLRNGWLTIAPLVVLIYMILDGRTPSYAAVYAIIACVVVGFMQNGIIRAQCKARGEPLPSDLFGPKALLDALANGARATIAIGAAAACVGIIVGVVTLTGSGFRVGSIVITTANDIAAFVSILPLFDIFDLQQWSLFFSLVLVAMACIVMGAGVPTTATYIILVSVTAGAFQILGVEPIVAHFFVFYYGVLADITPPVALAAYAAAGIAGSNPFKTGNTAFRLGIAKALVPFVFVYSPALLLVAEGFSWPAFTVTLAGAAMGIGALGIAFTGYLFAKMPMWQRVYTGLASLFFIAPGLTTFLIGAALLAPVLLIQVRAGHRAQMV
ncbi:TRAP transporter, 4TM/12TM fusion protein [Jannaschia faecimaris]|uniref:TRAP transporter, 4TM/12TM fusion protein n=1 Tax=Jannaschia faecimaris TaxID=1244108 RepID=A0A1H3TL79_9RHOB|nr:TRAP transporter permease [Jannaschia faecimaris]SDZ51042.1 TRAP transporter, 4TM/12TM fusion protein [Jannaschia faecimaris]